VHLLLEEQQRVVKHKLGSQAGKVREFGIINRKENSAIILRKGKYAIIYNFLYKF